LPDSNAFKGKAAEKRAAEFLLAKGYRIVSRNVRLPGGEIDLLCRDGETIVVVEVKMRTTVRFGTAFSAVDRRKRATLRRLADEYLQIVAPAAAVRFDIVAFDGDRMTLHRNAF
jgi:putative endonuclease